MLAGSLIAVKGNIPRRPLGYIDKSHRSMSKTVYQYGARDQRRTSLTYGTNATVILIGTVAQRVPLTTVCRFTKPPEESLRGEIPVVPVASAERRRHRERERRPQEG